VIPAIGVGAGGHAKVVLEILRLQGQYEPVGLLDPRHELWGTEVLGVPVLGGDTLLGKLYRDGIRHVFIGVGSVGDTGIRRRLYDASQRLGFTPVRAIHPRAVVAPSARIGEGATVMACAVVNADAVLGHNVIVNTGAIVEHDCVIGDHVHVATGARLAGGVSVGDGAHIGVGAAVREYVRIGHHAVVGAGSAVVRDVPERVVVGGAPARILKHLPVL
jgi:sugar O-acyltransferase (sialic acid O-acetyltransferase NeuD family)